MTLAEDILSACADNADYTVPLKEWMNGKTFFHDYKVHDFPLVDLAYRLDPKNPNIPVSILILSLENRKEVVTGGCQLLQNSGAFVTCTFKRPALQICNKGGGRLVFSFIRTKRSPV